VAKKKRDEDVRAREALEKRQRQQARDRLPLEELPSEPKMDGDDSETSSDEVVEARGLGSKVPPQVAPAGGPKP
jgi:hypothetical protein